MALDNRPLSITTAFSSIKSYFQSQENNSTWKDLTTSSEGTFLMRLLGNVVSVISRNTVTGRRESFHDTANLLSSQIGLAVNNGYSVYRGRNQIRNILFTPSEDMVLPAYTSIGNFDSEHQIYVIEDTTFVKNKQMDLKVLIGNMVEVSWVANTTGLKKFHRFEQNISEDYQLYVDSILVPTTSIKKEETEDKYYVYTNPWKSVTVEYLNNSTGAKYKYDADSIFRLRYVELDTSELGDMTTDMFMYGILNSVVSIENAVPFEDVEEIKANSPTYRETQNMVRSKGDFGDIVKHAIRNISKTGYKPLTPSYTAVTYLMNDYSRLNNTQLQEINNYLTPRTAFGRPLPDIVAPVREVTTFDITLGVTNKYTDEASIAADVQNVIDNNYTGILNQTISTYDIENLLNKFNYVKYSRVSLHTDERKPLAIVKKGDFISQNGKVYRAVDVLGTSGVNEPDWNTPDKLTDYIQLATGLKTSDGTLVWECYKRLNTLSSATPWKAGTQYTVGDYVYSENLPAFMFKCTDIIRTIATETPDVVGVEVGDFIEDGEVLLLCITYNADYVARENKTSWSIGDKYNIGGKSFQYVGYLGKLGSATELKFNTSVYSLYAIDEAYRQGENGYLYIDDPNASSYIKAGDIIQLTYTNKVSKEYEEVDASTLNMSTVLDAKVKDYQDSETPDNTEATRTEQTYYINLGMLYTNENIYIKGSDYSYIRTINVGSNITDGDIIAQCTEYDAEAPDRLTLTGYSIGDAYNVYYTTADGKDAYKTFAVVGRANTTTVGSTSTVVPVETPEVNENSNWKKLEAQLEIQKQIHDWIVSDTRDTMKVPADVLDFYEAIGKLPNGNDRATIEAYYVQYDVEDEKQIYMYMDQFEASRLDAIVALKKAKQLREPISDCRCLKYKDVDGNIIYVDKYTADSEGAVTVNRYDSDRVLRVTTKYSANGTQKSKETFGDSYDVQVDEKVTVQESITKKYSINKVIKDITRILPTVPVSNYEQGDITISFTSTNDGDIRWVEQEDVETIDYDWNVFNEFALNLNIKY